MVDAERPSVVVQIEREHGEAALAQVLLFTPQSSLSRAVKSATHKSCDDDTSDVRP
jgi:hypothetical protein